MIGVTATRLEGPLLLHPSAFADDRGFFIETFRRSEYRDLGITAEFVQDNHSRSVQRTLRGLHLQLAPGQPKLVRVARGRVFDAIVDVRRSSPTLGQWEGFELDDRDHAQLYIPVGFAHGFCVLSDEADVVYKVASYYDPETEAGIAWNDPQIGISWPCIDPVVSQRDAANPPMAAIAPLLPAW